MWFFLRTPIARTMKVNQIIRMRLTSPAQKMLKSNRYLQKTSIKMRTVIIRSIAMAAHVRAANILSTTNLMGFIYYLPHSYLLNEGPDQPAPRLYLFIYTLFIPCIYFTFWI